MNRKANRARLGQVLGRLHAEVQPGAINGREPDAGALDAEIAQITTPGVSAGGRGRALRGRPLVAQLVFAGMAGLSGAGVVILSLIILARNLVLNLYLIAGILALGSGVLLFLIGLILGLVLRPVIITPARYQAEQVKAHPDAIGQFPPDRAWPLYAFRQAGIDRRAVGMYLLILYRRVWRWLGDAFPRGRHVSRIAWWLFFPVAVAVIVFLLAGGLSAWCCYAIYWLVSIAFTYVSVAAAVLIAACLRVLDGLWRRTRQAHAFCVNCFYTSPRPAYRCPGCAQVHHDIRPGRLGLFTRRCECGVQLPTRASRGARRLNAVCQRCQHPLSVGPGVVRDVRIPIFGDRSAGKTRFLYAALNSLMQSAEQAGITISFPDPESEHQVALGLEAIRSGQDTPKSSTAAPSALTIRLGKGRKSYLVRLFDVAGEHYRDARQHEDLRFLDHAQGLVYVLDPFSIQAVQEQLTGHETIGGHAHAAAGDPEIVFGEVVSRMRDSGVSASAQRLAVVVSKADLLGEAGLELPGGSVKIADWLFGVGQHNTVLAAGRDFAEVRFFAVTSQDVSAGLGTDQDDPAAPLRWLLACHGIPLSASPAFQRRSRRSQAGPVPVKARQLEHAHADTATHGDRSAPDSGVFDGTLTPGENPERTPRGPVLSGRQETAGGGDSGAGTFSGGAGSRGGSGPGGPGDPELPPVRHLTADLPERAPAGRRISLIVQITLAAPDSESVPLERLDVPAEGRDVTITVSAPALVALGDLEQDVHVPSAADSEPIRFGFKTGRAGLHRVLVRAFAGGTFLGELALEISVEVGAALEEGPSRAAALAGLAAEPGEVTLQVSRTGEDRYSFQLIAEALYPVELTRRLAGDPTEVVGALVEELRAIAAHASPFTSPELVRNRIRSLGAQLWADVVPEAIRRQFWAQAGRIKLFTVASDMDTVPWELLYPVDGDQDNGFLVEQFPVVRRVYGQSRIRQLQLSSAAYVVPPGSPENAMDEVQAVRSRLGAGVRDHGVVGRLDSLIALLNNSPSVLHFACHNQFSVQKGSVITLDGGPLRPSDLAVAVQTQGLATASPLVFFNACRTAGEIPGLMQMMGWAKQFMGAGAGAFLGSLWAVRSSSARAFADAFYQALVTDQAPLGEASLLARQAIRGDDGDPTWLAYTIYGNPSATIRPGRPI